MARIGVEESLTDIQQELEERGYQVVALKQEQDAQGCDCCVVTGHDENIMNIQDTVMEGSVINAQGYTAEEVGAQVEEKIQQQE
ncbi:YkuS family protein [Bacillus piscicola]|uniref:YkuS family protein n=1 Tax=Bacillus piscicola TaxID=1632684 RepID=UPI001F089A5C|nr:YkuS family protein [Bacillus piscicola]